MSDARSIYIKDVDSVMNGLITDVEAIPNSTKPINESLSLNHITLMWTKTFHCLHGI